MWQEVSALLIHVAPIKQQAACCAFFLGGGFTPLQTCASEAKKLQLLCIVFRIDSYTELD